MQEPEQQTIQTTQIPESKKLLNERPLKQFRISIQLISETSLDQDLVEGLSEDQKIEAVIQLKSIHLEWLNIRVIQNLEVFTNLNILYLQHNKISKIQHLDCLKNLQYLALNHNLIQKVTGLSNLKKLSGLNLTNNQIEQLSPEQQLPKSLQLLSFKQNPICLDANYKNDIIKSLPLLEMLDDMTITAELRLKVLGKFPQHLIQYNEKMKQFRKVKEARKLVDEDQDRKKGLYLGSGGFGEEEVLREIREKTRKFMHEAQEEFKKDIKEQNQNFQVKMKISKKIRNFKKQQESNKQIRMSQIQETNEQHNQQY